MKQAWVIVLIVVIAAAGIANVVFMQTTVNNAVTEVDESMRELQSAVSDRQQQIVTAFEEAQSPEKRQKWEYHLMYTFRDDDTVDTLSTRVNELGSQGWEYVGYIMNNGTNARVVVFKRPARKQQGSN